MISETSELEKEFFDPKIAYVCIDGWTFVLMYGPNSANGLAQLIERDKDGLPAPVPCKMGK